LLDVREADELLTASVQGAVHIPMKDIPQRMGEIPTDVPVYVMCHHGGRSERAANYLQQQGRTNVYNMQGGIDDWATKIDTSVARY
jgi:rhodanese-related sulfurtransferase